MGVVANTGGATGAGCGRASGALFRNTAPVEFWVRADCRGQIGSSFRDFRQKVFYSILEWHMILIAWLYTSIQVGSITPSFRGLLGRRLSCRRCAIKCKGRIGIFPGGATLREKGAEGKGEVWTLALTVWKARKFPRMRQIFYHVVDKGLTARE